MGQPLPQTDDVGVTVWAIAWEIVRLTTVQESPSGNNKPPQEIAQVTRDVYLTLTGSAPKK